MLFGKIKRWSQENYREIMLVAMFVEISLMAVLVGLEFVMLLIMLGRMK
jgi:hypothetical protein